MPKPIPKPKDPSGPVDHAWATRVEVADQERAAGLKRYLTSSGYYWARSLCSWHGQSWYVLDAHAEQDGELLELVSQDCVLVAHHVRPSEVKFWR